MELFFKMKFVENVLVYVFGVFTFSFCYCFYEGFIHKIILVSQFLPFICISYLLKVFKFDTGILLDSGAVSLLKSLSRLPQSIAVLCLILFLVFACNNFPFRAFVTMIYSGKVKHELRVASYEFKSTSYDSNPRVKSSNPRVRRLNARVVRLQDKLGD